MYETPHAAITVLQDRIRGSLADEQVHLMIIIDAQLETDSFACNYMIMVGYTKSIPATIAPTANNARKNPYPHQYEISVSPTLFCSKSNTTYLSLRNVSPSCPSSKSPCPTVRTFKTHTLALTSST